MTLHLVKIHMILCKGNTQLEKFQSLKCLEFIVVTY